MPAARGVKRSASKAEAKSDAAGPSKIKKKTVPAVKAAEDAEAPIKLGQVLTCGQGDVGQLGLGEDSLEKSRFTIVTALGSTIVDICAGGMHTVCVDKNGDVWTFGCNDEGALGRDTSDSSKEWIPGKVNLPGKAIKISAGDSHTAALLHSGQAYAWGSFRDSHGNMGLTPKGNERTPVELLPGQKVVQIASGGDHLALLTDLGQIFTCGCAEQGQLGRVTARSCDRNSRLGLNPLLIPAPLPFRPRDKTEFDRLWAGTHCTFARDVTKGDIYAWGLNNYQQIGVRKGKPQTVFTPVVSEAFAALKDVGWSKIAGGPHHTLALDSEGVCYVLGRREYGRLGLGEGCEDALDLTPVPSLKGKKCTQIACGSAASFAVTDSGDVYAWGMGSSGQLGTGEENDEAEPRLLRSKQVEGRVALNISAGGQHTVLLVASVEQPEDNVKESVKDVKPSQSSTLTDDDTSEVKTVKKESNEEQKDLETKDEELAQDKGNAKAMNPEKMEVDSEVPKEEEKPAAKKTTGRRGRKGSVSSTTSNESTRVTKSSKNKQNGGISTSEETQKGEHMEKIIEEDSGSQPGGTQKEEDDPMISNQNQKSKREETECEESDSKRLKLDCAETNENVLGDKMEVTENADTQVESGTEKVDNAPVVIADNGNKDDENLANGNNEKDSVESKDEISTPDVEMKSVNDVEKKCVSSEVQDEKTEDDATRTEVSTS